MVGKPPLCNKCGKKAVILDRVEGIHLCETHLKVSVEERVLSYFKNFQNLPPRVGIAFSGGKDSSALIASLVALKDQLPFQFIALTIDEGICGYREDTIRAAEKICNNLKVQHHIISFSEVFEGDLDHLVAERKNRACTVCGILRRRALEILAKKTGVQVIATGHNLDDHAQTALMNIISGDTRKVFAGMGVSENYAIRIKPFSRVTEREVTIYAMLSGVFHPLPECPYAGSSLRGEIRHLLNGYEREHPGTMKNAAQCEENIRKELGFCRPQDRVFKCQSCGWPASSPQCQVCSILGRPKKEPNSQ